MPNLYTKNSGIAITIPEFFYHIKSCPLCQPKNEISTPAATAEPITPEILLDIQ